MEKKDSFLLEEVGRNFRESGILAISKMDEESHNKKMCKSAGMKKYRIFWEMTKDQSQLISHSREIVLSGNKNFIDYAENFNWKLISKIKNLQI